LKLYLTNTYYLQSFAIIFLQLGKHADAITCYNTHLFNNLDDQEVIKLRRDSQLKLDDQATS